MASERVLPLLEGLGAQAAPAIRESPCPVCEAPVLPKREHGRFCSDACRAIAWKREHPSGRQLKLVGMAKAEGSHHEAVLLARFVAQLHAGKYGQVTIEDVYRYVSPKALGAAAGAVFLEGFERIGFCQSQRAESRCRIISRWRNTWRENGKPE